MRSTTQRRLVDQGYLDFDDIDIEEFGPWLRLTPALCGTLTLAGIATGWWLLFLIVAIGGVITWRTGRHPFDRIYDWVVRPMLRREDPLPLWPAPRRFSAIVAAGWLVATGLALLLGAPRLATVLGLSLGAMQLLAGTIDVCTGCLMYHRLRNNWEIKKEEALTPAVHKRRTSRFNPFSAPTTEPRGIIVRHMDPIRRSVAAQQAHRRSNNPN